MKKLALILFLVIFFLSFNSVVIANDCKKNQIPTAIGCISTEPSGFVASILGFATVIGGAVAFLLIIFGAFQILTSSGQPEKVQGGKELITSAIAGLLLIIFAVFILRLIGAEILKIPGFE